MKCPKCDSDVDTEDIEYINGIGDARLKFKCEDCGHTFEEIVPEFDKDNRFFEVVDDES